MYANTSSNACNYCINPPPPPPPPVPMEGLAGNLNTTQYIVATSPASGMWTRYFTPLNLLIRNQLPGVQIPNPYYASGATAENLRNQKLYIPSQNVQNIQVKVISDGLRTTTSCLLYTSDAADE